jgi:hypothetical protein
VYRTKRFIFQQEWMEYKDRNGQVSPNRRLAGPIITAGQATISRLFYAEKINIPTLFLL